MAVDPLTDLQDAAVAQLRASLDSFGDALAGCLQVGLQPADALRASGIDVPGYASPMVNNALARMVEDQPEG
jgi:hypothetical protein